MGDRPPGRTRKLHGGTRHHHRQRCSALHRRRHGGERGRGVLGGHHLPRLQRHRTDGLKLSRPDAGPQEVLPDLSRSIHAQFAAMWLCPESECAAVVPDAARLRRRGNGAGRSVDPRGYISAGEARPGLCGIRRGRRGGPGGRADARRLDIRQHLLAVVLPDQRAGRRDRDGFDRADPARTGARTGAAARP